MLVSWDVPFGSAKLYHTLMTAASLCAFSLPIVQLLPSRQGTCWYILMPHIFLVRCWSRTLLLIPRAPKSCPPCFGGSVLPSLPSSLPLPQCQCGAIRCLSTSRARSDHGLPYEHDFWLDTPLMWIRFHFVPRSTLFVPSEKELQGVPDAMQLGRKRMTCLCTPVVSGTRTLGTSRLRFPGETLASPSRELPASSSRRKRSQSRFPFRKLVRTSSLERLRHFVFQGHQRNRSVRNTISRTFPSGVRATSACRLRADRTTRGNVACNNL